MHVLITGISSMTVITFSSQRRTPRRRRLQERRRPSTKSFETFVVTQMLCLTIAHNVILALQNLPHVSTLVTEQKLSNCCSGRPWLSDRKKENSIEKQLTTTTLHPFNGLFSRTTWVSRHQKGKPFWILLEQEIMRWQWHQLDHMQIICTALQTDNHASTSPLSLYRPDALPDAQSTASKH